MNDKKELNYLENLKSELLNIVPSDLPLWLRDVKLPPDKVFNQLLDITFGASMQTEEGVIFHILWTETG